jgi:phosphatidylglycerophosphate synthase
MNAQPVTRRPVRARTSGWAAAIARTLARLGLRPNQVSLLSVIFSGVAGLALVLAGRGGLSAGWTAALLVVAALGIELRLLCNLLDGMLAIEGGMGTRTGPLFNELPDRLADALTLVCAGFAAGGAWGPHLGWAAALLAVGTASVRLLGGALGLAQDFRGPMAKQQRMQTLVLACAAAAALRLAGLGPQAAARALLVALVLVVLGCVLTLARRTAGIARGLRER